MKINVSNISFNVSKTINIGNFEAIKINYGQSITIDPTKDIEEQRKEIIRNCSVVRKQKNESLLGAPITHTKYNNIQNNTKSTQPKYKTTI